MKEWLMGMVRPQEEPFVDTAKRVVGASAILIATLPVPNKNGFSIPEALTLSDAIDLHVRDTIENIQDSVASLVD